MKISLLIGLAERSSNTFISPLSIIDDISEVSVISDIPSTIDKTVSYIPPQSKNIIIHTIYRNIWKLLMCIRLSRDTQVKFIYGVYLYMDGIIAFFSSRIVEKPCVISLIAGDYELHSFGRINEFIIRTILKRVDIITVTGSKTKNKLLKFGIPEEKIVILPNIIDHQVFYKKSMPKIYDIVWVGRIEDVKNLELLISIVSKIVIQIPQIKVAIAGVGSREQYLKKLTRSMNLERNIQFLGYINNPNDFLNQGKLFILTSHREGFPLATLEAMKCGLACISCNVGDTIDIIDHGKNGYIVNNPNPDEFAQIAIELLNNHKLREIIGNNAISTSEKFSVENSRKIWINILNSIL